MMPRVTVIDHNERRILMHDGTAVRVIPCDPYHSLKYVQFDGNRIFHSFGGDRRLRIEETYNDGIFNAYRTVDGRDGGESVEQVVQISDALGLARAVLSDNGDAYGDIFAKWYGKKMQSDIVEWMIVASNADRVMAVHVDERTGGEDSDGDGNTAYIVDGRFMVDGRGAAYYFTGQPGGLDGEDDNGDSEGDDGEPIVHDGSDIETDTHGTRFRTNMRDWHYLCLVADERKRKNGEDDIVDVPGKGTAALSSVTRVVIAKIAFLLYPTHDGVFLSQLPVQMRRSVARMIDDKEAY